MAGKRNVLLERFFNALISGDRAGARDIVDQAFQADVPTEKIISNLIWPTLEHVQTLYRNDQLSDLAHNYATRLLRALADQMQIRLEQAERLEQKVLLVCGPDEPEELAAQLATDLLEASGYEVYFAGGGVANDEIVAQIGELQADILVVFGAKPSTVPFTRLLIDRLHELDVCPRLQIAVGGGVFNRAEGLAEEIGADLWANTPWEIVEQITTQPERRMAADQRTVGRKRRTKRSAAA
jgi:methanogenic corrinoid protein MtbC1